MIVRADADLDRAAEGAVRGAASPTPASCASRSSGCTSHEAIADEFLAPVRRRASGRMRLGADAGLRRRHGLADLGRASSRRVTRARRGRRRQGRDGARRRPGPPRPRPVLLRADRARRRRPPDMTLCRDETFGPVVSIYRVQRRRRGRRARQRHRRTASTPASGPATPRAAARSPPGCRPAPSTSTRATRRPGARVGAPMGGMKASGLGRRHGAEGIAEVHRGADRRRPARCRFGPPLGRTDEQWAALLTAGLKAMKSVGLR